jgi:hypothetical protein
MTNAIKFYPVVKCACGQINYASEFPVPEPPDGLLSQPHEVQCSKCSKRTRYEPQHIWRTSRPPSAVGESGRF